MRTVTTLFVFSLVYLFLFLSKYWWLTLWRRYFPLGGLSGQISLLMSFWNPECSCFTLSLLNVFFLLLTYPQSTSRFWALVLSSIMSLSPLCVIHKLKKQGCFHWSLERNAEWCRSKKKAPYTEPPPSCPQFNNLHSGHSYPSGCQSGLTKPPSSPSVTILFPRVSYETLSNALLESKYHRIMAER